MQGWQGRLLKEISQLQYKDNKISLNNISRHFQAFFMRFVSLNFCTITEWKKGHFMKELHKLYQHLQKTAFFSAHLVYIYKNSFTYHRSNQYMIMIRKNHRTGGFRMSKTRSARHDLLNWSEKSTNNCGNSSLARTFG